MLDGEGVQVCCPTGYTCLTGTSSSYSKCVATTDANDLVFGIQVRWQESDLSILQTDPTVPGSTFSAQAAPTASKTENGASSGSSAAVVGKGSTAQVSSTTSLAVHGSSPAASGGLSSGATIGLTVGASK